MADAPIRATSAPPNPQDQLTQAMVKELILAQQKVLVDYAKHLATVAFAAIGLVFTLSDKWLGTPPAAAQVRLLGFAVALYLVTGVLATAAAGAFPHRVSLADHNDVEVELGRVARRRYGLTVAAFLVFIVATALVGVVAIGR